MKKRTILTSLMSIVLLALIAVGSTYALFTSEDSTNVAVTSGKVDVSAEIDQESLKLYSMGVEQVEKFENGGTAEFDEEDNLKLSLLTPGDSASFTILVENNSNIDIKYRIKMNAEGELVSGLNLTATNGETEFNVVNHVTDWLPLPAAKELSNIHVTIELPVEAGNEYQEKEANLSFVIEAIQANGFIDSYVNPWTIDAALANAKEGSEIKLAAGFYEQIVIPQNGMTIYSEEDAVVGFLNVNGKANVTIKGLTFDAASAQNAIDGKGTVRQVANLVGASGKNNKIGARNLVIDGCTFTGKFANNGVSIAFVDQGRTSGQSGNITISNCKFEQQRANYNIYTYYSGHEKFEIVKNKFASKCFGKPVYLGRYQSGEAVVVKVNTFSNTDNFLNSAYIQSHSNKLEVSFEDVDNKFGEQLIKYVNPNTIANVLENAQEGAVVELAAGTYNEIVVPQNGMKIYSLEGAVVGFLNVNGKADVTIQGLTFDAALAKAPYNFKDKAMTPANIVGASGSSNKIGARNLVIDGCTFAGEFANGGVSIAFVDQNRTTGPSGNITIKNCEFDQQNAYSNIYTYYSGYGQFVIEGNDFVGSTIDYPIYLGRYQSNEAVSVKGNEFSHIASIENAIYLQAHSSAYNPSYAAEGNVFAE